MQFRINQDLPCPNCQYNWRSQLVGGRCPECGVPIPSMPTKLGGWIDCPRCGKKNIATSAFCYICRETLPAYLIPDEVFQRRQPPPSRISLILPILNLVIAIASLTTVLLFIPTMNWCSVWLMTCSFVAINLWMLVSRIRHNRRIAATEAARRWMHERQVQNRGTDVEVQ